jgi:Tfp pilus assembly protein PilF
MDAERRDLARTRPARSPRPTLDANRARSAQVMEEDEPTVRMLLEDLAAAAPPLSPPPPVLAPEPGAPVENSPAASAVSNTSASPSAPVVPLAPPLPNMAGPTDYRPLLRIPDWRRAFPARERYAMLGVALFVVGVLVGVIGAAAVMKNRVAAALEDAAPRASAAALPGGFAPGAVVPQAPKPAGEATPVPLIIDRAPKSAEPIEAEAASPAVVRTKPPDRGLSELPISSSKAPSCRELLGDASAKRQNAKAALRETQLANRQLMLGNVRIAQAAYCNALTLDRSNVDRHVNLARLYLVRRDWEKVAEYGQSALELDPKSRSALGVTGDALAALHKTDDARKAWLAAERKPQASPRELRLIAKRNMALATRVARLKDFLLAERLYRRVLLIEPENADAIKGVAVCLLKAGDYRAAQAWARRAAQLSRGH